MRRYKGTYDHHKEVNHLNILGDSTLNNMIFVLKVMQFVSKMMKFVSKMIQPRQHTRHLHAPPGAVCTQFMLNLCSIYAHFRSLYAHFMLNYAHFR